MTRRGFWVLMVGLAFTIPVFGQISVHFREDIQRGMAATTAEEYQASLDFCNGVLKAVPGHAQINYLAARLNAQLGHKEEAIAYLKKASLLGYTTIVPFNKIHQLNDTAFVALRQDPAFKEVIQALKQAESSIHEAEIAFTLSEKGLTPEGITYDPVEKRFYFGSESKSKIVKVDGSGRCEDFTVEKQDGLDIVLGIHVDAARRHLWACSQSDSTTDVFKYDLETRKLLKRYSLSRQPENHSFNDLVIHPSGDVYVTEAIQDDIYRISLSNDELEVFFSKEPFVSFNGITLSDDGRSIYVADARIGIYKIDLETQAHVLLTHDDGFDSSEVDGLYCQDNQLYAVQTGLDMVCRFSLNPDGTVIESRTIYERNTPYLDWPTTGVLVDDAFYFIADTQGNGDNPGAVIIMRARR